MSVSRSVLASSAARSACASSVAAQLPSDGPRDGAHALHPLALRAQLVVIDHLGQSRHAAVQRFLAVLVEEELGVGQARAHHALVATDDGAGIGGLMLLTTRNLFVSLPAASSSGKYFWLAFIVRIRHSCGTARNWVSKLAHQHVGALDQRRHLVQQRVVFDGRAAAAHPGRCRGQLAHDLGAALGEAGDHRAVTAQRVGIAVGVGNHHRGQCRFKAVALCGAAGLQAQRLTGTTVAPCSATRPCAGRTKCTLLQPGSSQSVSSW
jgi:hypothetical protein